MLLFTPSVASTFNSFKRKKYKKAQLKKNNKVMSVPSLLFSGEENNEEFSLLNEFPQQQKQIQSLIDLHQIPGELWLTRKRIEAGVLEQKKQREMLTNVQERLAQCRLEKTKRIIERKSSLSPQFRLPRSHSPPHSSERFYQTIILPERPSTSQYKRQQQQNNNNIYDDDELFFNKNLWNKEEEEEQQNINSEKQFRNRLNALEQQMERLNLFTIQTLSSKIEKNIYSNEIKEEIKQKKLKEIIQEFYKLKKNINKLRENTKLELKETNSLLNQKMGILIRQLKREIILNRRISISEFEKIKEKEINILRKENQKLISLNEENENKLELTENNLKEIIERIYSLPFLNISDISFSSISSDNYPSINDLIISIRSAIERSTLNERKRGEASLEAYKAQTNDELINERLKNEREIRNIEKEKRFLLEQKETEWFIERNKLINELEQVKSNKAVEIAKIEENNKLVEMTKIKNLEEKINKLNTELINEKNKFIKELNQNNEKNKIEINEYKLNINDLKTKLLLEQKEHQKSQILINELKEIKTSLNEELIAASDRLSTVESQLAIAYQNTEEATTKFRREKRELINKFGDIEMEVETLKEQLDASELRLKKEREDWIADAERSDRDWKAQNKLLIKAEIQKKELIKSLEIANSKLEKFEHKLDIQTKKEQTLRSELLKLKEELKEERIQTENIIEGKEKEFKKELEKLKLELLERTNELKLAIENETELNIKLEDSEHKIKKAGELCQKLSLELDKLSEKSFNQSTCSEKLLADLEETKEELSIFRNSLEEQKRKNIQLETEIKQMEKERIRIENIFEKRLKSENEQYKLIEEKNKEEDNSIELLIKKWEEKIFGKELFGELIKRIKIIFEYLIKIIEENKQKIKELEKENKFISSKLIIEQKQLKEEISIKNEENKLLKLKFDKIKNEIKNKINKENNNNEKEDYLQKRKILEKRIEQLEEILIIERTEKDNEIEKSFSSSSFIIKTTHFP
ncbi:hypothetical protein Mgra_00005415, partial [Meloidogyne graminicola]